jgi:hypothetical protein
MKETAVIQARLDTKWVTIGKIKKADDEKWSGIIARPKELIDVRVKFVIEKD